MSDPVSPVGAATSALEQLQLNDVSEDLATDQIRGSNFNELTKEALNNALKEISDANPVDDARTQLSGIGRGDVEEAKEVVQSDVTRPGVETPEVNAEQEALRAVENRARNLYGEMMVHHIAWGVAQRMQKDMSQLLRGS